MSAAAGVAGRAGVPRAGAVLQATAAGLIFLSWIMLFSISPMLLTHWGIPYEIEGGSAPAKLHPATWAMTLGVGVASLRFSSPFAFVAKAARTFPGLIPFFVTWLFVLWDAIFVQKMPFTPMIDCFWLPLVALVGLATQTEGAKRRIALAIHALILADALIGLGEYLLGFRLTPYVAGEFALETDWRSTALLGHPLANAVVLGCYMIVMSVGGGRDLPKILRPAFVVAVMASMIAFGGRTALVLSMLAMAGVFAARFVAILSGARFDVRSLIGLATLAPVAIVALIALYASGFFDQMITRFVNDNGSAKARLVMLSLFKDLNWEEILFGPNPAKIGGLQRLEGIEYGLESFFVAYVISYGAIVSFVFFGGLACFCREIVRASRPASWLPVFFYFVVAATSVSLSAKTTTLGILVAMLLTLLRPRSREAAGYDAVGQATFRYAPPEGRRLPRAARQRR